MRISLWLLLIIPIKTHAFHTATLIMTAGTTRFALHLANSTMMPADQQVRLTRQIAFCSGVAFGALLP